jgi:hypothetical protein
LILNLFADPATWREAHVHRTRSNLVMAFHFLRGIARCLRPMRTTIRRCIRHRRLRVLQVQIDSHQQQVIVRDWSPRGLGLLWIGRTVPPTLQWTVLAPQYGCARFRLIYRRRLIPFVWHVGLEAEPALSTLRTPELAFSTQIGHSSQ